MNALKELNIGLIGVGRIGTLHGDNLTRFVAGARVDSVVEIMLNSGCVYFDIFLIMPLAVYSFISEWRGIWVNS